MLGVSKAAGGATKLDHSDVIAWQYAPQQLAALPPVDVIVAAFITNDVLWGATPADLLACFQALAKEISATRPGTAFFVATAPPRWDRYAQDVATVNATLRAVWPPRFLVDFDTGFGQSLFIDAVHVSVAGQQLRARRAYEAFLR
jgi:lysophospholipase L1-like esterase